MAPMKKRGRKAEVEERGFDGVLPDRIVITGFMATGKSVVGRRLAEIVKRPFVDLDRVIESAEGNSVSEIITRRGEEAFRALESREAARIARLPKTVIATGGGTLLSEQNCERLLSGDTRVFVLTASVDEIMKRLGHEHGTRPLLAGGDPRERVTTLLAERAPVYAALGERIDTTGLGIDETARAIVARIVPPALASAVLVAGSAGDAGDRTSSDAVEAPGIDDLGNGEIAGPSDVDAGEAILLGADADASTENDGDDGETPERR